MFLTRRLIDTVNMNRIAPLNAPPTSLFPFMWYYVRQFKYSLGFMCAASMLASSLNASGPAILRHMIDTILTTPTPAEALPKLEPLIILYIGVSLILGTLVYFSMAYVRATIFSSGFRQVVRLQLHNYLLQQSWTFFQNDFAGRLSTKVMEVGTELRSLSTSSRRLISIFASFITACVSLFFAQPWLVVIFLVWAALYILISWLMIPGVRRLSTISSNAHSYVVGRMVDIYTNIATVKLFTSQENENATLTRAMQDSREKNADMQLASLFYDNVTMALEILLIGSLLLSSLWFWYHGLTTPGTIAMVVPLSLMLVQQAASLREEINGLLESVGVLEDAINTLVHPLTVQDAVGAAPLAVTAGKIKFSAVTFAYNKGTGPILNNLNLTIPAGQKVGLIGHSGAGKSTLVNLLLRFYEVSEGAITIDGHDIAEVTQNSLRAAIGMVTQDTSLLHRSIRDNIAYGKPDATDAEIISAAKLAHADAFIQHLTDKDGNTGYNSKVGERGVKLSGGQRQRIAIARLILKNAPILIMDEATAALDSEVEYAIQENLTTLMEGKTVIAIAHRLSTISQLDRLLVLEHGEIVEDGTHAELLKQGGAYARLWARQSGGFLPE